MLVLLVALAACKGDERKAEKSDSPYRPMAACGVGYQALGGWEVADPAPITGFPIIEDVSTWREPGYSESHALFTDDGLRLEIACNPKWTHGYIHTPTDEVVKGVSFDEFLEISQDQRIGGVLTLDSDVIEVMLASGETLEITLITSSRGLVERDQRPRIGGFGGFAARGKHVLIGFGGIEEEVDLDAVRSFLGSITLR